MAEEGAETFWIGDRSIGVYKKRDTFVLLGKIKSHWCIRFGRHLKFNIDILDMIMIEFIEVGV